MKKLIACLLVGLLPATTMAQQVLPRWHMTGQEACYDFENAKLLLKLDSELSMHRETADKLRLSNETLHIAVDELKIALANQREASATLLTNNQLLETQLKKAIEDRNKAETNQMPGLGWTIAGVITLVVLAVAGGIALDRYVFNPPASK